DAERVIKESICQYRRSLLVTDGVCSMDGDVAPLDKLYEVAERYGVITMVDDAHGEGVLGRGGRGIVAFGQVGQVVYGGHVAVHAEHPVGHNKTPVVGGAMLREQIGAVVQVVMAEGKLGCPAERRARHQAGVAQFVGQDQVARPDQARDDAHVGEIARAEHDRPVGALKACKPRFQLGEQRVVAGNQARRARAHAIALDRLRCGLFQHRMVAQV
ncbi:MAG: aminotransferase class I/II-fold pyridoxal phosphate-dependent enzyme, partial [Rhodospirillales bacterium]|nr:aminotransferase class I/II-fold pyridoxal phosphate-dependent enzyme [Rhodospirillales bacterium]